MTASLAKKHTLQELASLTNALLIGDPQHLITGVENLEEASSEEASFLANTRYQEAMKRSHAGVIFISPSAIKIEGKNYLIHENPSWAFQQIVELFFKSPYQHSGFQGVHETAVIHPSSIIGIGVQIGPYVTIDQGVSVGDYTIISSHVSIGSGTKIGTHCQLHPHVTIRERCVLGDRVVIQPGAVIGSCGFGFSTDVSGVHTKLDQIGSVEIEDDVEIGANTTIDRARFKKTLIRKGTKIDNLVQIGHNVQIGPYNIIVSQTGISGSTKTGRNVVIGGQCGIVGHIEIADGIMIAAKSGVSKTLSKQGKYAGVPVLSLEEHNRQQVHLRKISDYVKRLEALEQKLLNN